MKRITVISSRDVSRSKRRKYAEWKYWARRAVRNDQKQRTKKERESWEIEPPSK